MPVSKFYEGDSDHIYEMEVGDLVINVTGEHPFYVVDKGWVRVKNLQKGDVLRTNGSMNVFVSFISKTNRKEKVFNIEVGTNHNYFISEKNILVHNKNIIE